MNMQRSYWEQWQVAKKLGDHLTANYSFGGDEISGREEHKVWANKRLN